jgi:hypothetical protein
MSRLLAVACCALALPLAPVARAQELVTVHGRIVDQSTGLGIPSASLQLGGHGAAVSGPDGTFRFESVRPGGYVLWVVAFGYASGSRTLAALADVALTVPLEPAPLPLEGVGATFVELKGRVRDGPHDVPLVDAMILTNQGRGVGTDAHGRFEMEGVLEGAPLRVTVVAFGYRTLDTLLVPRPGQRHAFDLEPDPRVQAMIDVRVAQLEERAAPLFGALFHDLDRDELIGYAGKHTLRSMIEFEFGQWRSRIALVIVDGERWTLSDDPLEELFALLPEELQRIEFQQRRGCFDPVIDVYVYTRDYMRALVALDGELPPVWDEALYDPFHCGP